MTRWAVRTSAEVLATATMTVEDLAEHERQRWARLVRPADRDDYLAAHLLVRDLAAAALGTTPALVEIAQVCADCGGPHGRPQVLAQPALWLSLSHAHGWVAAVAADRPCGIDVELSAEPVLTALTPGEQESLAALDPADRPRAFARLWVRKEAVVKAGAARIDDLASLDVRSDRVADCELHDLSDATPVAALAVRA